MCIIVHNPEGKPLDPEIADNCLWINGDGTGFVDLRNGKFQRTMSLDVSWSLLRSEFPYICHCRYATKGEAVRENIHPFRVDERTFLFHNGTVEGLGDGNDSKKVAKLLSMVPKRKRVEFLKEFKESRFLLYDTVSKKGVRVGKWYEQDGIWFSKDNVLDTKWWKRSPKTKTTTPKYHTVAVYGTLKAGFGNHQVLEDSIFIGNGATHDSYRLCVEGLPYLIRDPDLRGHNVEVEVYQVDDETLETLDELEGHPDFYCRDEIQIKLNDGVLIDAWCYFSNEENDNGRYLASYESSEWRWEDDSIRF